MGMPLRAWIYLGLIVAASGLVLAWWLTIWRGPNPAGSGLPALLLVLAVAAQHFPLAVAPGYKVSAVGAVYLAALLLLGPPAALLLIVAAQILGGGTLFLRRDPLTGQRRRGLPGVMFNVAQFVLAFGLGGLVYYLQAPSGAPAPLITQANLLVVPLVVAVIHLVNSGAVALMVGLQRGQPPWALWRTAQRTELPEAVGLAAAGLVTALLAARYLWAPLLLIPPVALLHGAVTRALRLQEASDRAAAELRAVLESVEQGVLVTDPAGRVRFANHMLGMQLDLDAEALVGQLWPAAGLELLAPRLEDPEGFAARLAHLTTRATTFTDEIVVNGPVARILKRYSGPVYAPSGQCYPNARSIIGRIEVYSDITKVQQLERDKDEFVASAGHELRTPLTTLGGYLELAQARLAEADSPSHDRIARYLGIAQAELARLRRLAEDLLTVGRLQANRPVLHPAPGDLAVLACETVDRFVAPRNVASRGHRIVCHASGPLPAAYDHVRLEQVLANLLENAAKYSPAGGEVVVTAERAGDEAIIAVRDQGIGVPPEDRDHLFKPFRRAKNATHGSPEGLGLGLAIAHGIVEAHGGRLWVEDAPGGGSVFRLALPLAEPAVPAIIEGDTARYSPSRSVHE